jgi:hypothetical protein
MGHDLSAITVRHTALHHVLDHIPQRITINLNISRLDFHGMLFQKSQCPRKTQAVYLMMTSEVYDDIVIGCFLNHP